MTNTEDAPSCAAPNLERVLTIELEAGRSLGAQCYVSRHGRVVADIAMGEGRRGEPMRPTTLLRWLCCSKPMTATIVGILKDRGLLAFDDPVARWIPEFRDERAGITLRHLLTHTAGFAHDAAVDLWKSPEHLRTELVQAAVIAPPGTEAFYTGGIAFHAVGLVVEAVTGAPFGEVATELLFGPLGMARSSFAITPEEYARNRAEIGVIYDARTSPPAPLIHLEAPGDAGNVLPGISARGPMKEMALAYECLLQGGTLASGRTLLERETVDELLAVHRSGLPDRENGGIDYTWGLGFANDPRWFPGAPPGAVLAGHNGLATSFAVLDRSNEVVVAAVFNGMLSFADDLRRRERVLQAAYADLAGNSSGPPTTVGTVRRTADPTDRTRD